MMFGRDIRLYYLLVLIALVYLFAFLFSYSSDLLAQSPVLDARENLALAQKIKENSLPKEPIYRALLYPWLLAYTSDPIYFAPWLGLACHLLNAVLCGLIAIRLWSKLISGWVSGMLYVFYPVSLFFAVQVLDITFAISLFLLGIYFLLDHKRRYLSAVLAGLFAGFSILARPNFLIAVALFPAVKILFSGNKDKRFKDGGIVIIPIVILLVFQGLFNYTNSGEFRFLPWQGSYNLYASNRIGANGKFFKQQVFFSRIPEGNNPTRMESEYLYRINHEGDASPEISVMNAYWKKKLISDISQDPLQFLKLFVKKVFYLFNDWEQYNNTTYAYHKDRFILLRFNPLGWGIIFCLSSLGLYIAQRTNDKRIIGFLVLMAAYAVGVLMFFVSARFRLPLAPMLCICAGGLAYFQETRLSLRQAGILLLYVLGLCLISYGNWFGARDKMSFIQDEILLAGAANRAGYDEAALGYTKSVLAREPQHPIVQGIKVISLFNLWLDSRDILRARELWFDLEIALNENTEWDETTLFIRGVYQWRSGEKEQAKDIWKTATTTYPSRSSFSFRALQWVSESLDSSDEEIRDVLERYLD